MIQMPQFLCDELQDYLKQLYGVEPDSRMFPISKSYLHQEMDRGCKQTGVKRIRIHDLRHTYATRCFEAGVELKAIADQLGHASPKTSYELYIHLFEDTKAREIDKLAGIDKFISSEREAEGAVVIPFPEREKAV